MTRSSVAERIALTVTGAIKTCPQLQQRKVITTHAASFGSHAPSDGRVDITVIALWLGHESQVTTHGYIEADLAMKERALATIDPPEIKRALTSD
ncbi:site-specific integrase [Pseudomonas sp. RT4P38]